MGNVDICPSACVCGEPLELSLSSTAKGKWVSYRGMGQKDTTQPSVRRKQVREQGAGPKLPVSEERIGVDLGGTSRLQLGR
jgi:hypothetical protein